MRPARDHFRRHQVILRAAAYPDDPSPVYAGLDGVGGLGVAVAFPDPDADPPRRGANVQPTPARDITVAEQELGEHEVTIYVDVNPDLTDPSGAVRKLRVGDGVEAPLQFPGGQIGRARGHMIPDKTAADGTPVSWQFRAGFRRQ